MLASFARSLLHWPRSGQSRYGWPFSKLTFAHGLRPDATMLSLVEQIKNVKCLVDFQRHLHVALWHGAQFIEPNLPVNVDEVKIRKFLKSNGVAFDFGYTCFVMDCVVCKKKTTKKAECQRLYVNKTTGSYLCHHCGASGSWTQLEDLLSLQPRTKRGASSKQATSTHLPLAASVTRAWDGSSPVEAVESEALSSALHTIGLKGISLETLRRFEARLSGEGTLVVPLRRWDGSLAGVRVLPPRGAERTLPASLPLPAGWGTVRGRDTAVLTARLVDALAVTEKCRVPALALPHGITILPQECLPLLERFNKLTLWFPGDVVSWNAVRAFARKLDDKRCYTVRPSTNLGSPLEALASGGSLVRALDTAAPLHHDAITTFSALRQDVYEELANATQVAGVQWQRFPGLNRLLRGHRRGELTVVSGPTGAGKTTFISEYSLDLAMQGVNTLWGSFEINNIRLAKVMLQQMAGCALDKHLERFQEAADAFELLPIWFMTFHGQQNISDVLDAMSHATYVHDIGHVVLDNLQFMMGVGSLDRFYEQDMVISKFRRFATMKNCHVSLVIHPRKERPEDELGLASIFGGARATQEADNVLIMQLVRAGEIQRKFIQVLKNRFSGDLGQFPLQFNRDSLSFAPKPKAQRKPAKGSADDAGSGQPSAEEGRSQQAQPSTEDADQKPRSPRDGQPSTGSKVSHGEGKTLNLSKAPRNKDS